MDRESGKKLENDTKRDWEQMDENILLKILMCLSIVDLIVSVSGVCRSWHKLSCEPCLWNTLNLSTIRNASMLPNYINFFTHAFVLNLGIALARSQGNVTSLICPPYLEFDAPNWEFVAERTPMLQKFVMPLPSLSLPKLHEATKRWPLLESVIVSGVAQPMLLMDAIGSHCPKLSELKLLGLFSDDFAEAIITFAPNLKVLSVRGCIIYKEAFDLILSELDHLEVLNISHCLFVSFPIPGEPVTYLPKIDASMRTIAAKLKSFIACEDTCCPNCQYVVHYYKEMPSWFASDDIFWKMDEVASLTYWE